MQIVQSLNTSSYLNYLNVVLIDKDTLNVLCQNILSSITPFELKLGVNFYVLRASQYCLDMKHFEYTGKQHKFLKFQKSHKPNSL